MLSEGLISSGLWWGCGTTQVAASDAQAERGGPAWISSIHSLCVCIHTGIKTYTPSQMSANTVARMPAWLPHEGLKHSAAAWWQGTLIKWELPRSATQIKKKSVCTSLVCWATGVWFVFVCGCGWGGYLKPSHPLNLPSSASIERQQKQESRLRAKIQFRMCSFPSLIFNFIFFLCWFIQGIWTSQHVGQSGLLIRAVWTFIKPHRSTWAVVTLDRPPQVGEALRVPGW